MSMIPSVAGSAQAAGVDPFFTEQIILRDILISYSTPIKGIVRVLLTDNTDENKVAIIQKIYDTYHPNLDEKMGTEEYTVLHIAAGKGLPGCLMEILSKGANYNATDKEFRTPLHLAAIKGDVVSAETLINVGATIDATDAQLRTPLHYAVMRQHAHCVGLLKERGANPELPDSRGSSPCDLAETSGDVDLILALSTPTLA